MSFFKVSDKALKNNKNPVEKNLLFKILEQIDRNFETFDYKLTELKYKVEGEDFDNMWETSSFL